MLKAAYKGILKPNKINIEIYEDYACILLNFVVYYISLNSKAVISDRLQQHLIRTGIEVVITALTRNFLQSWLFSPLKKPINTGFSPVRKLNILLFFPSVLSKSFWKKCGITYTESCPSGRRCSTRNPLGYTVTIPLQMA